jgi:hypothetical protein
MVIFVFRSRDRDRRPILSAGSDQLHQDLVGVDGHRPNLWQEVRGQDVQILINTQETRTSLTVQSLNGKKSDEKVLYFF